MANGASPRVVYLGPEYTFSHEASLKLFPGGELTFLSTFKDIFSTVQQGRMDYGVLPVENSSTGAIAETYQLLLNQDYEPGGKGEVKVQIVNEIILPISHNLLAANPIDIADIRTLYSNEQPLLQCSEYLGGPLGPLSNVEVKVALSTSEAAVQARRDPTGACLGSHILAEEMQLTVIEAGIQDLHRNMTRFFAISAIHRPEKGDKSTFAIVIPDKPGMLVDALQLVSGERLNLSNIKTLPAHDDKVLLADFKDWFVLDVEAAKTSARFKRFLRRQQDHPELIIGYKFLGTYPATSHQVSPLQTIMGPSTDPERVGPSPLLDLLARGETHQVEFKSTLRWDLRDERVNKELTKVVAKTIAAFMNSSGGILFIGVGDSGEPIGIEKDIAALTKNDEDGFQSALFQIVIDTIGAEFCRLVSTAFVQYQERTICVATVEGSSKPVWVSDGGKPVFYIRTGNSSRPLDAREALDYVMGRFKGV